MMKINLIDIVKCIIYKIRCIFLMRASNDFLVNKYGIQPFLNVCDFSI